MMSGSVERSPTVAIDDAAAFGSDEGAWHTAIAHTPRLRAQVPDEFPTAEAVASNARAAGSQ